MAIYHMNVQPLSRQKGHNVVAAIAYRRGIKLKDDRTGKIFDYSKKKDVIYSEILIPENAPEWIVAIAELQKTDPRLAAELLWNTVEKRETRKDAQLAREIRLALPIELTEAQSIPLCKEYVQRFCRLGMVADFSIHWDKGNPHVHILLSMRSLEKEGWGQKQRAWNSKEFTLGAREHLAEVINKHLSQWGFEETVSHLSYVDQGIDQEPTLHVGSRENRTSQHARLRNQQVGLRNLQKIIDKPEIVLEKLSKQRSSFSLIDLAKTLSTQLTSANQEVLGSDREPPKSRRLVSGLSSFMASVAPKFFYSEPQTSEAAQAKIQEVPTPSLDIPAEASIPEVIAKVLEEITLHESVFTEYAISKALSLHVQNPEEVASALLQIRSSPELLSIGPGEDGRERYTTREMFDTENQLQDLAEELSRKANHPVKNKTINLSIQKFGLKDDQASAIRALLKGGDLSMMVGRAGTGKSYSLKAAHAAWEASQYRVLGIALAGIAAEGLEQDSGIPSRTIQSFCCALEAGTLKLTSKDVIVMDEAGMTDCVSMFKVMILVWQVGAKLVLVGDHAQLQPVGPGAIFRALLERIGFVEITTIRRQEEAWQREATAHFAAGNTEKALGYYEQHGCLHLKDLPAAAMDALIHDWATALKSSPLSKNLILAHENEDIVHLNHLARQHLKSAGGLSQRSWVKNRQGKFEIAVGERLLFLENNWRYAIRNGQRGTVTRLEFDHHQEVKTIHIELDGKQNKTVSIDPLKYKAFSYGYACTVYRAQGITVKHAFVYMRGRWNKYLSYVAMSRHETSAGMYASQDVFKSSHALKKGLSREGIKDSVLDYPLAFGERRGIDAESRLSILKQHLGSKLQWMVQSLSSNFEQTFFPKKYWTRKAEEASKQQAILETLERREDAKVVAAYVDANREVGAAWEVVNLRKEVLELKADLDVKALALALKDEPCLKAFKTALVARDQLAYQIYQSHGNYTRALALYDISLERLREQHQKHETRQTIETYLREAKQGRVIFRDRLAAGLYQELKAYYPLLKDRDVDVSLLKAQAKAHLRRRIFIKASAEQRQDFKLVEHYIQFNQNAAKLWQSIAKQDKALGGSLLMVVEDLNAYQVERLQTLGKTGTPLERKHLHHAKEVNQERDALAATLVSEWPRYQTALDFYGFSVPVGEIVSAFDEQSVAFAKEKRERLEKQADRFKRKVERTETLKHYVELLNRQDESRYEIATQIIESKKNYYSIIFECMPEALNLLRALHKDAKADQRLTLLKSFSEAEREAFLTVERYVQERKNVSKIWHETKDFPHRDHPLLKEISESHSVPRDALAALILDDFPLYEKALNFFNIKIEYLSKNAFYHNIRIQCEAFKRQVGNFNTRMEIARKITRHRSAYTVVKQDTDLNWNKLLNYTDYSIRQERIAALSSEEQQNYKDALKYKRFRRDAGKVWSEIFALRKEGKEVSHALFTRGIEINEIRNELAFKIRGKRDNFDDFLFSGQVRTKDIEKHAKAYEKHLSRLKEQGLFKQISSPAPIPLPAQAIVPKERKPYWNFDEVYQGLLSNASHFVESILGSPNQRLSRGNTYRYGKKGSLVVTVYGSDAGLWYNFETGEKGNLITLVQDRFGYNFKETLRYAAEWAGIAPETKLFRSKPKVAKMISYIKTEFTEDQLKKIEYAKKIVENSLSVPGTLADRYLKEHRKIMGPVLDRTFKFNPAVFETETKQYQPALVVIARNEKQEVQAVQCIYLNKDTGNKLEVEVKKKTFGPLRGASILVQEGDGSNRFALAEGPETALSVGQGDPGLRVWTSLSISNFGNALVPTGSHDVLLCADNDGIGAASDIALTGAARLLSEQGINVWCVKPSAHKDFNDVLKAEGVEAVKVALQQKFLMKPAMRLDELIQKREEISNNSRLIVDFEEKNRQLKALKKAENLSEVLLKVFIFEEVGNLATLLKGDQTFFRTLAGHGLEREVSTAKANYTQYLAEQNEVKALVKDLKPKDAIQEYLDAVLHIEKLTPSWMTNIAAEKEVWREVNTKIGQLAYIINKTPSLQYVAEKKGISKAINSYASEWQQSVNEKLSLALGVGVSIGN